MRDLTKVMATLLLFVLALGGCTQSPDTTKVDSPPAVTVEGQATGEVSSARVTATEDHVRLISRTVSEDQVTWLVQSGSACEFTFTGTSLALEIAGDESVEGKPELRPRYAVLVDGAVVVDEVLEEHSRRVEVISGEEQVTSVVKVIHLSEASRGAIGVKAIEFTSAAEEPIVPTEEAKLRIAFIGDSITCGYGVETNAEDEPFTTSTENFMATYAYLTAQELGADYETCCFSGYGIVSGWTGDGSANEDMLIGPQLDIVGGAYNEPWDHVAHPADVVVINLGTNDYTYTGTDEGRMREFAEGYAALLSKVRGDYPEAEIVCTLGTMGCHELHPSLEQGVEAYRKESGDERVSCYLSDEVDYATDGNATGGHPNVKAQAKSATVLVSKISERLTATAA